MTKPRLQFSIRGILFLTAIVSGVLAFAVRMPAFFQVSLIAAVPILFFVGLLQGANFATSDRRPRMAIVAWSMLGLFFALFTSLIVCVLFQADLNLRMLPPLLIGIGVMGGCFIVCARQVHRAYGLATSPADIGDGDLIFPTVAEDQS
jgi:hypothetical protein